VRCPRRFASTRAVTRVRIRAPSVRKLETAEQLAQEDLELCDLRWIEALKQLAIADRDGRHGGIHDLQALVSQLDKHAAAIVRVG